MVTTMQAEAQNPTQPQHDVNARWHLWQSDSGACYATRSERLTDEQIEAGCAMTLGADTPEELASLLDAQPDAETVEG